MIQTLKRQVILVKVAVLNIQLNSLTGQLMKIITRVLRMSLSQVKIVTKQFEARNEVLDMNAEEVKELLDDSIRRD